MLGREHLQIRQAGHGAIVFHDFTNHGRGAAPGQSSQVTPRFSMPSTHQHPTIDRLQGKNMAWLHQITGLSLGRNRCLHRAGTVCRTDAGGDTFSRFNRHRKRRAVHRAIACGHGRQAQVLTTLTRKRQANQATAKLGHEVNGFGTDVVRSQNQITLVFAVLFIDQNDHAASTHISNNFFNWRNCHRGKRACHDCSLRTVTAHGT